LAVERRSISGSGENSESHSCVESVPEGKSIVLVQGLIGGEEMWRLITVFSRKFYISTRLESLWTISIVRCLSIGHEVSETGPIYVLRWM
jgi:hypothetical protein